MKSISILFIIITFSIIVYSYFIYPLGLWIFTRLKKKEKAVENHNGCLPYVSVLIAAHNEEKVIEKKIKNTLELDYPKDKIEILLGSDGSDDGTDEICKQYSEVIAFQRIEPRQGKPNVLNTLSQFAKGDVLLFTDANTIFEKDALRKMVFYFSDDTVGGVSGRLVLESPKTGLASYEKFYWNYESGIKDLESKVFSTVASNGGIYTVRRELFKMIPKDTIVDDFWISLDILESGKRILFENEALAYENVSENVVDEFWRKVRIGSGNLQTFVHRPVIANQKRIFTQIAYYSHKVIRWLIPCLLPALYLAIAVLQENPIFSVLFHIINLFLLVSLIGIILEPKVKTINYICYFTLLNFALLYGYVRYLFGRQSVIWRRAKR